VTGAPSEGDGGPRADEQDGLWDRALEEAFAREAAPTGAPAAFSTGPRTGRFRLLGEIARGGMGVVYRAHDEWLRRDVALKIMRSEYLGQPEAVERFLDEAQVGGQLHHPGIVPIHDVGVDGSNRPFICMELVRGRTLASLLTDRTDASVDRGRFVAVFEHVCQTLAYAHSRGVIHRDLKPSNVMVGAFGEVRVVDWGFAKVRDPGRRPGHERAAPVRTGSVTTGRDFDGQHSQPGSVMGTPGYMPPEQGRGEVDAIDERSDVFALGAMLCEVLTGKRPFLPEDGTDPLEATRGGRLDAAFARLAACGADPDLVRLARRCLDPNREGRPHDAGEVARAIADHHERSNELTRAAEVQAAETRGRAEEVERSRRMRLFLSIATVVCVIVAAAVLWWANARSSVR
jgi:serine/threonine protein kinase